MASQATDKKKPQSKYCIKCDQFWGSEAYQGMCSGCYTKVHGKPNPPAAKVEHKKKQEDQTQKYQGSDKGVQIDPSKCFKCNKKLGLLGTKCKCSYVFCNLHRMPEDHTCTYNFEAEGKDHLKKQIKKVEHGKLEKLDSL